MHVTTVASSRRTLPPSALSRTPTRHGSCRRSARCRPRPGRHRAACRRRGRRGAPFRPPEDETVQIAAAGAYWGAHCTLAVTRTCSSALPALSRYVPLPSRGRKRADHHGRRRPVARSRPATGDNAQMTMTTAVELHASAPPRAETCTPPRSRRRGARCCPLARRRGRRDRGAPRAAASGCETPVSGARAPRAVPDEHVRLGRAPRRISSRGRRCGPSRPRRSRAACRHRRSCRAGSSGAHWACPGCCAGCPARHRRS
ncbi:hypothetical protein SAMN05216207_10278 [Pseudonocardia ammonioxydans]|uniref:Uncharacterized protein n=1 Tax=Pseudonocardia ammonioxydans TaxID=260086 RepID=A0A1I5DNZ8_PSUAM|nr:hypothetical protein SAMN05216207_10278 [Pseudonocardia ammonioxydans]